MTGGAGPIGETFPESVQPRLRWRPYQQRILAGFEKRAADRHFHLIAAPGAGKTVLGLEVVRRIGRPALVLAPSLALREQWAARFRDHFIERPDGLPAGFLANDLDQPGVLTLLTYQGLDALARRVGVPALLERLARADVGTLVLDEAHHLRRQWWSTVHAVKAGMWRPFVVALTATPPYDATRVEWNRYHELCGEVDDEISTPELVRVGDLAPHQDFVYFTSPTERETERLVARARQHAAFVSDLPLDAPFVSLLADDPVVRAPHEHIATLLRERDYFLAVAVFLGHVHGRPPAALAHTLGLEGVRLPGFDLGWAEILLDGVLRQHRESPAAGIATVLDPLERRLRALGAWERGRVALTTDRGLARLLRTSAAKLRCVADIVELESRHLGDRLRCAVLTDHIRERTFTDCPLPDEPGVRLGAVPIFEHLRRLRLPGVSVALLTGRLAVVPAAVVPALGRVTSEGSFTATAFEGDDSFVEIRSGSSPLSPLVGPVTRLLADGRINVLVGTVALLGEGWDAPAVNTMVLATAVGSQVTSNQLRGRAIRVDPGWSGKASNVWHLACVDPTRDPGSQPGPSAVTPGTASNEDDGDDWQVLHRRFLTFVGPDHEHPQIRSGIERLGVETPSLANLARLNARMCSMATARETLSERWRAATVDADGPPGRIATDLLIPGPMVRRSPFAERWPEYRWLYGWLSRRLELERARRIAQAVLEALVESGLVSGEGAEPVADVSIGTRHLLARLNGADLRSEATFIQALHEVFDLLTPPRYLLVARGAVRGVPRILSENKEQATRFHRHWRRRVGRARLLYVHTPAGQLALLRAQERQLAARTTPPIERRLTWR